MLCIYGSTPMTSTSKLLSSLQIGLENMQQQGTKFFDELTAALTDYKTKKIEKHQLVEALTTIIKRHTNITVVITLDPATLKNAWVEVSQFDAAHVMWPDFYQGIDQWQELMKRPVNGTTGFIDTVKGRVGGIFAECKNPMTITAGLMNMPADEIAAIILHEVGHVYTMFYYIGHITISNLVVTQATREALGTKDLNKRRKVLNQATQYLSIEDMVSVGDLEMSPMWDSESGIETLLLNAYRERHKSITGTDLYDVRSCEQLADQFAVKHGAGLPLAKALGKISGGGGGRGGRIFVQIMQILIEIGMTVVTYGIWFILGLIFNSIIPSVEKDYDDPKYRIRRIAQDMIDRIKRMPLTREDKAKLIGDYEKVMKIETSRQGSTYSLSFRVAHMISKRTRNVYNQQETQKLIEDLLFNPLYVSHAKLQNLG